MVVIITLILTLYNMWYNHKIWLMFKLKIYHSKDTLPLVPLKIFQLALNIFITLLLRLSDAVLELLFLFFDRAILLCAMHSILAKISDGHHPG